MKYIRTKNGVYEVKINKYHELVYCKDNQIVLSCNILKQSENLEELCDRFVVIDKRNNVHYLMDYDDVIEEIYCGRIYEEDVVYGAIWTDKGLIYVSKMNEQGELELI